MACSSCGGGRKLSPKAGPSQPDNLLFHTPAPPSSGGSGYAQKTNPNPAPTNPNPAPTNNPSIKRQQV